MSQIASSRRMIRIISSNDIPQIILTQITSWIGDRAVGLKEAS